MKRSPLLLLLISAPMCAKDTQETKTCKVPLTFNAFVQQYVPASQQEAFVAYYERRIKQWAQDKRKAGTNHADRAEINTIRASGQRALELQMPELAQPAANDTGNHALLCMRYGMYDQFLLEQKQQSHSFMAKARSYFRGVRYKLSQWVDSARSFIWRPKTA